MNPSTTKQNIDRTSVKLMSHRRKIEKRQQSGKVTKNNCRIKSKPHAHLQTMENKSAKLHNDRDEIV